MIPGFSTVPQSLDLIPEEMDSASAQFLSAATTHVGGTDAVIQHSAEVSSATPFPSTAAALDVHVMENTPLMKDSGAVVQTLLATSATERCYHLISLIPACKYNPQPFVYTPQVKQACHTKAEYEEYGGSICRTNPVFKGMY
eukprot:TRINITY_DN881_c0_g1_i5.p1 TRINITY_DN881_c0_g1~~TRINITY_DN881_c0_g1_i5.p1  ORF type:complete len:142 (+),score=30.13 TRINITY_DN881_c0_g1_i5:877-1302(+)